MKIYYKILSYVLSLLLLSVLTGISSYKIAKNRDTENNCNKVICENVCNKTINNSYEKYDRTDIDKYPFLLTPDLLNDLRDRMKNLISVTNSYRISVCLFHNQTNYGYLPNSDKKYTLFSVIASESKYKLAEYDEIFYQNISLRLFDAYFEKSMGPLSINKNSKDDKKEIYRILTTNTDVPTYIYVIGIENNENKDLLGLYKGFIVVDFQTMKKISKSDEDTFNIFSFKLSNELEKIRRKNE